MKRGALALSVVLLSAGCSTYGKAIAPGVIGERQPTANRLAAEPNHENAGQPQPVVVDTAVRLPAAALLHAWDRKRAHAWATGDTGALASLYVRGSRAGRADVALLRSYLRRGLHVVGLRMQVFAVLVLSHHPQRWRLRVTDRLARAVAVGPSGPVRLPRDLASTRILTLVRGGDGRDGHWRVASVKPLRRR